MKNCLSVLIIPVFFYQTIQSQTVEPPGKPIAEIFSDFHYNINDTTQTTGFGLNRAYFGYNYRPLGDFSATIILNIGSPDDLPPDAKPHRFGFYREASITYSKNDLTLTFGITGTRIYEFQQKFWGKRYIANTFQSLNGYGFTADLGVYGEYKLSPVVRFDMTLMNGEGYSNIQLDNNLKASGSIIITPDNSLAFRAYGDIIDLNGLWQATLIGFAGIKTDLITFGAEFSYKTNLDLIGGHNAWGISTTGAIKTTKRSELFVRYDRSASIIPPGQNLQWNYPNDGDYLITGIQYTLSDNVRVALDYQGRFPYLHSKQITNTIFFNTHFKF
jgi:hypothetical protein